MSEGNKKERTLLGGSVLFVLVRILQREQATGLR